MKIAGKSVSRRKLVNCTDFEKNPYEIFYRTHRANPLMLYGKIRHPETARAGGECHRYD
jgi:hypothetical protein